MDVAARAATSEDLDVLVALYRLLAAEMAEYHPMWALADALPEPAGEALAAGLADPDSLLYVGTIDGIPFGFVFARSEVTATGGERVGSVRYIFTEPEAREVGIGEAMLEAVMEALRVRGHRLFDAHVLPGHRAVKNFFEAGGFSARSIVMHHRDG